jgi:hypothetical protein
VNWRLKRAIRHALLALPSGDRLYRWLAHQVLGSMSGAAGKWFRVFPERVAVLREHCDRSGESARAQRMWCFDSGATIAPGLAMGTSSDAPGLLTDRWDRLSNRYCQSSRQMLQQRGDDVARASNAPADRVEEILRATSSKDAPAALAAIGMTYCGSHAAADPEWQGNTGFVFSGGALEHYAPEELDAEVARMARALQPGGLMSHVVDHRDHRWHADKSISPLDHLTVEEDDYLSRYSNPLEYHNRWLRSSYVDLFARHGFTVACRDVRLYTADLAPLDRSRLTPPFAGAGDEDLHSLVTHFMAVRTRAEREESTACPTS